MKRTNCVYTSIGNYCDCVSPNITTSTGCLPEAVLGGSCKYSQQCPEASDCNNGACICLEDYVNKEGKCVEKLKGRSCTSLLQCSFRAECKRGNCVCESGYVKRRSRCVRRRLDNCYNDAMCQKTVNESFCHVSVTGNECRCPEPYIITPTECLTKENIGSSCKDSLQCPRNSICNNSTCVCKDGYVSKTETCAKKREDKCQNDQDCKKNLKNAICLKDVAGNVCKCPPSHVRFNFTCILEVNLGESCIYSDQCPEKSACINNTCDCRRDYYIREDLECVQPNFGSCNKSAQCPDYGECNNGTCICSDGYTKRESECVQRDLDECYSNNDCEEFIQGSVCLMEDNGNVCQCPSGYIQGVGKCLKKTTVGGSCEYSKQCPQKSYCDENVCVCEYYYIWNGSECVSSKVGDSCKYLRECPQFSSCDNGTCICSWGYANNGGTCVESKVGDSCNDENECPPFATCDNGICICRRGYANDGGTCVKRYVGDSCKQTKECPLWSLCQTGTCICGDGYIKVGLECEFDPNRSYTPGYLWGIVAAAIVSVILIVGTTIIVVLRRRRRNGPDCNTPSAMVDVRGPV